MNTRACMKHFQQKQTKEIRNSSGIALVITLLMLSVITFLAVAFLVLTRGHRDSVTTSLDLETAKAASQAGLARAQSEIIARMMAHHDLLNYDYMASHNFINPNGFIAGLADPNNVNYDHYNGKGGVSTVMSSITNPADWAQNIANLIYDPRPPVFIKTNAGPAFPVDFRFWVDLNRNGKFETNGYLPSIGNNGLPVQDPNNQGAFLSNFFNGEPEWIGGLQYPEYPHSATNRFLMRYAYLVLPIGKTLDFNYIHNYSKSLDGGPIPPPPAMPPPGLGAAVDGFVRDQGVGSWELNLAALLWELNNDIYINAAGPYKYVEGKAANSGYAFDDAYSFLRFRYNTSYGGPYPLSLAAYFGPTTPNYNLDGIDEYGTEALALYPSTNAPWPGSYATNNFYNTYQDVFNPGKTSPAFITNRLLPAGFYTNSYDRYTFQRMLAAIGTGSTPELQTYVYGDVITTNPALQPPTVLRTKVNLNYDNTFQIANGLNTSPTTLIPWTAEIAGAPVGIPQNGALGFFTNAAESLLRSQDFRITNYLVGGLPPNQVLIPTNLSYVHFGVTNIPVYNSLNPSIRYTENLHRMLQLAANIYDDTRTNKMTPPGTLPLPYPSVFRPIFFATNYGGTNRVVYIAGYTNVNTDAIFQISKGFVDVTDSNNFPANTFYNGNIWGIPWVVGAVKGLPAFDRYVPDISWAVTRKLLFARQPVPGTPFGNAIARPAFTNQFFIMSISNIFGLDAWNSYASNISLPAPFEVIATTVVSVVLTNNSAGNPGGFVTNFINSTNYFSRFWTNGAGKFLDPRHSSSGMLGFLQTNVPSLPPSYFSETQHRFVPVYVDLTNDFGYQLGTFLSNDLRQTAWPVYGWTLSVTNRVMYALVDPGSGQAFDFVNLGPFGTNLILTNILYGNAPPAVGSGSTPNTKYWDPTPGPSGLSAGLSNQIANGISFDPNDFGQELVGVSVGNSNLYFSCSNDTAAVVFTGVTNTLIANDPLVHYTVGDLTPPLTQNVPPVTDTSQVLTYNDRYEPWPNRIEPGFGANMTLKDPQITSSDDWNFPANKFPSIGWLGRVHRGTPWQTIFLKADPDALINGVNPNQQAWIGSWVSTFDTYPTNDYALLDLFTAAPNDNAARGLLSVNQTNSAPWYALFSGIALNTNAPYLGAHSVGPPIGSNLVLDPTIIGSLVDGMYIITNGANNQPVTNFIAGINVLRSLEPDQTFHSLGSVFKSPILSTESPFLPGPAGDFKDEEVEAIPQQVAGLLKLGQPQFVIYSFGQALKPKDIYFGGPPNFNLCTNYQITGEFVTRTVCHIVGDPTAANLRIQVDSFNILPAD